MEQKILLRDYSGGISLTGERKAQPFSAKFIKNLNIYEDPSYITLSKQATEVTDNAVGGLGIWAEDGSPFDTNRYFYLSNGELWRETSGGVWSNIRTVSGSFGEGFKVFNDYLYYMIANDIGRYGKLSGTPAFDDNLTSWWDGAISDIQTTGGGTGQTYSTATSIAETATHRQTFTTTHDPLKEITIDINDTGDDPNWTVTVHDSEDNLIGSKTIAFASITTGDNIFTFATALRLTIGNSYHFHVTTSTTTGAPKVTSNVASDLEGAEFIVEYGVLIATTEYHPAVVVEDKLIVGNRDYLAVFDEATYDPNKILLERGFEVVSITKENEMLAISAYKGDTISTAEESRIFYWDTIAPSWNYFTDTTSIGVGNSITNSGNVFRGIFGNRGALYESNNLTKKIAHTPKLARSKIVNVYPSALSHHEGITLIGIGNTNDGSSLEQGIYAYGAENSQLGDALVLLYTISTGDTQSANIEIGFVSVIGDDIYFSWRNNTTYGIDKIEVDALAVTSGSYESLIFDNGDTDKSKLLIHQLSTYEALETGETVTNKIKFERTTSFTAGTASNTVGDTRVKDIFNKRFKEVELEFEVTSTGSFPKITQHEILFNDLNEEGNE